MFAVRNHNEASVERARELRRDQTMPEKLLWSRLRDSRLGFKFRRQVPMGAFTLDFFCPSTHLCVEIDGVSHEGRLDRDLYRERVLRDAGITTIRFSASDVGRDVDSVAEAIRVECCKRKGVEPW